MKIKLNESKTLEFNVDTKGCSPEDLKGHLRFTFEGIEYGFPAIFEEGIIRVEIPAFQKILSNRLTESISSHKEVTVKARMDIVANNEAYVSPWNGEIDIEIPVSIQVKEEKTVRPQKKVDVSDPSLLEAFDDAVKTSKIKDILSIDIKKEPDVKKEKEVKEEEDDKSEKDPDPIPVKKSRFAQSLEEAYVKTGV
jgi:hypothetical protein